MYVREFCSRNININIMNRKLLTFILLATFGFISAQAQDSIVSKINIGSDLTNRYVWRGLDFGSSPSVQPYFEYAHKSGLTLGCWSAFSTTGTYNEIDLYAKYTYKNISIIATDYFFPTSNVPILKSNHFFNYKNASTGHGLEGTLQVKGGDKLPLTLTIATFFHGADKNSLGEQQYSTYSELAYTFDCKAGKLDAFAGFTPKEGLYGNTMGFVNIGVTGYKSIEITDRFSIPMKASLITNPQVENIYFVVGITL